MFITLAIILVLFIIMFIVFLIVLHKMTYETFKKICAKKVKRIAKRNELLVIDKLNILNYSRQKIDVDHIIFGKKYIYLITDFMLKGFISGDANDNSWVYFEKTTKKNKYLKNLNKISDKNIREIVGILGINTDLIVSICLIPNECDFSIKQKTNHKNIITHYSSLNKRIRALEKQEIGSLNETQIYEQYKIIEGRNNEEHKENHI